MAKNYDFSALSILVVEDNDLMASLLCSILSALRVNRVLRAANGQAAIEMINARAAEFSPYSAFGSDLIISDWQMEPIDGMKLLGWVRTHPKDHIRFLPFIMLTAFPEIKRVTSARDGGITEFLRKPVSIQSLLSRLVEVIERPRPFVRAPAYFGPDRRRREMPFDGADRRVHEVETLEQVSKAGRIKAAG